MFTINKNHFVDGVRVTPTPNKGGLIRPRLLIVHDTAGGLDHRGSVSWLCNPQAKASAHFVVGRKGEVVQLASCVVKTWHAGKSSYKGTANVNDFAIGIEIANPGKLTRAEGAAEARASFGQSYNVKTHRIEFRETPNHGRGWWMPYPREQLDAVMALGMAIRDRYGITEVAPHWQISPGRKIDTNPLFPLDWMRARMLGREDADGNDCRVASGAHIRQWPSFNEANIMLTLDATMPAEINRSGTFAPIGSHIPPQTPPGQSILWYNVTIPDLDLTGWVPFSDVELT